MKNIGIIGASGYTGAELLRLLTNHPKMSVQIATGETMAGKKIADLYPNLASAYPSMKFADLNLEDFSGLDLVFCALPHGLSQKIIPDLDIMSPYDYSIFEEQTFFRPYNGEVLKAVDFEISRGCIYSCSYCVETVIQKYYSFKCHIFYKIN